VQENVEYDILTKQYFPRVRMKERKGLETGLFAIIANFSLAFGRRRGQQRIVGPGNL
jgi:hypothetical protein